MAEWQNAENNRRFSFEYKFSKKIQAGLTIDTYKYVHLTFLSAGYFRCPISIMQVSPVCKK